MSMRSRDAAGVAPSSERSRREPELEPDLARAIQRMFPTLARAAVAVCRLHRLTPALEDSPPRPPKHP
jgi:hypothetical protein